MIADNETIKVAIAFVTHFGLCSDIESIDQDFTVIDLDEFLIDNLCIKGNKALDPDDNAYTQRLRDRQDWRRRLNNAGLAENMPKDLRYQIRSTRKGNASRRDADGNYDASRFVLIRKIDAGLLVAGETMEKVDNKLEGLLRLFKTCFELGDVSAITAKHQLPPQFIVENNAARSEVEDLEEELRTVVAEKARKMALAFDSMLNMIASLNGDCTVPIHYQNSLMAASEFSWKTYRNELTRREKEAKAKEKTTEKLKAKMLTSQKRISHVSE
jgi:hypothetical protein